jgi:hypothetical protein
MWYSGATARSGLRPLEQPATPNPASTAKFSIIKRRVMAASLVDMLDTWGGEIVSFPLKY